MFFKIAPESFNMAVKQPVSVQCCEVQEVRNNNPLPQLQSPQMLRLALTKSQRKSSGAAGTCISEIAVRLQEMHVMVHI